MRKANRYAKEVVSGERNECKWVTLACQRQIDDLANPPEGYRFDHKRASAVCEFVELFPHVKGEKARRGELIKLEPWQVFILTTVFGWVDRKGNRRFRQVYIEVPRGNAKSTLSAPLGLYMLAADREEGSEVYSAATTRDQAQIVFKSAQAMARKTPTLREALGVEVTAHAILNASTNSTFKALSADGNTLDGLNVHMAIVDELHAHNTPLVYEVLETGLGKRPQSMLWAITTAGYNKHGICYSVRELVTSVLRGETTGLSANGLFGIIYTIDDDDDPFDETAIRKANPNIGISVDSAHIFQQASKARQVVSARPGYLTKHLNRWVDVNSALFDTAKWRECENISLIEDDFSEDPCVIGLDLASRNDIAAKVSLYRRTVDGEEHYYLFPRFYLPRPAVENEVHMMYRPWEMQGDLVVFETETTDFQAIEEEIRLECPGKNISAIVVDPWQSAHLIENLSRDRFPAGDMRQTVANLSEATKEFDALMREGRVHHPGNAVLNWMIGNVVGHYDAKENVYPRKEMEKNKIDGAVAAIMALAWFLQNPSKRKPQEILFV